MDKVAHKIHLIRGGFPSLTRKYLPCTRSMHDDNLLPHPPKKRPKIGHLACEVCGLHICGWRNIETKLALISYVLPH